MLTWCYAWLSKWKAMKKKGFLKLLSHVTVESSFAMTASKLNNSRVFAPWNEMKQNEINESKKYRNNLYIELGNKNKVTAKSNLLLWEMKMYALWFNFHMIATINQMEISLKSTSVYHTIIMTMITTIINTEMLRFIDFHSVSWEQAVLHSKSGPDNQPRP